MAGKFLLLLDDIATMLDDIAILTKLAAKKTAGVVADDLAVNANQVSGVIANRELPVVWAVAKGSFWNKVILVPLVLLLAAWSKTLLVGMLIIGGLYLCYEGFEKVLHSLQRSDHTLDELSELVNSDQPIDLLAIEKDKIKGAIRTDFVLSAEIIVIAMGVITNSAATVSLGMQIGVLTAIAMAMTVGVYGLVALIVKLDDIGLYLLQSQPGNQLKQWSGRLLLEAAPRLMRVLSVFGTVAMFLVGGGILAHEIPALHHIGELLLQFTTHIPLLGSLAGMAYQMLLGLVAGAVVVALVLLAAKVWRRVRPSKVVPVA